MMKRTLVVLAVLLVASCVLLTNRAKSATASPLVQFWQHSVYVVGDSLTYYGTPEIQKTFGPHRDLVVDGHSGADIAEGIAEIRAREARPPMPPTVVLALGTNDQLAWYPQASPPFNPFAFLSSVEQMVDQFPQTTRVFVVNYSSINPVFVQMMREKDALLAYDASFHPNVRIINWASEVQPGWYLPDGVHYSAAGYAARAQAIAAAVGP